MCSTCVAQAWLTFITAQAKALVCIVTNIYVHADTCQGAAGQLYGEGRNTVLQANVLHIEIQDIGFQRGIGITVEIMLAR